MLVRQTEPNPINTSIVKITVTVKRGRERKKKTSIYLTK